MSQTAAAKIKETDRKVQILIADDHFLMRKRIRAILEQHPRFQVCSEAADGAKAIEEAKRSRPDVVLLDVTMPVLNGFEAAREINAAFPKSAIVILSANTDQQFIEEAKRIGARAYVAKSKAGDALIKAIEAALEADDFVLVE